MVDVGRIWQEAGSHWQHLQTWSALNDGTFYIMWINCTWLYSGWWPTFIFYFLNLVLRYSTSFHSLQQLLFKKDSCNSLQPDWLYSNPTCCVIKTHNQVVSVCYFSKLDNEIKTNVYGIWICYCHIFILSWLKRTYRNKYVHHFRTQATESTKSFILKTLLWRKSL